MTKTKRQTGRALRKMMAVEPAMQAAEGQNWAEYRRLHKVHESNSLKAYCGGVTWAQMLKVGRGK